MYIVIMLGKDPEQLYKNNITLKQRWTNATNTYIETFPDSALGIDTSGQNDRAYKPYYRYLYIR